MASYLENDPHSFSVRGEREGLQDAEFENLTGVSLQLDVIVRPFQQRKSHLSWPLSKRNLVRTGRLKIKRKFILTYEGLVSNINWNSKERLNWEAS